LDKKEIVHSTATGFAIVTLDDDSSTVDFTRDSLIGGVPAAAHIHCCIPERTNVDVAVGFHERVFINIHDGPLGHLKDSYTCARTRFSTDLA
jgi:CHRD domain